MQPAVFLDRDNTLIANDGDLGDPAQVRLLEGVPEGLSALRDAGYRLIVITNQGGVARGKYDEAQVDAVHQQIATLVDHEAGRSGLIDRFYYCPYHPEATVEAYRRDHPWRKPRPGMILQAARDLHIDLPHSWLIGDQVRDVQAGRSAGCRTVLVGGDDAAREQAQPAAAVVSFGEAVQTILREHASSNGVASRTPALPEAAVSSELNQLRRAMTDLSEELRMDRARRSAFTPWTMAAGVGQLLVFLLAMLGLLQLGQPTVFFMWMAGAALVQLITISILLADARA